MNSTSNSTETTRLPEVTSKRPLALPETTEVMDRRVRPCLKWTEVAEKALAPLQALVQYRIITPLERKELFCALIPESTDERLNDGGMGWVNSTVNHMIQPVRKVADACGIEMRAAILQKRTYTSEDLPKVSEQLAKHFQESIERAFSDHASKDSPALRTILQCKDSDFLRQLCRFITERTYLLENPAFCTTLKPIIETHWDWALKAIRPLSTLYKELAAGQTLLDKIAPGTQKSLAVLCQDELPTLLEPADTAILAEICRSFQEPHQVNVPISSTALLVLRTCFIRGKDPSFYELGKLFQVADNMPVEGLLAYCLEWFQTCDQRIQSVQEAVENICSLEKQLKNNLLPATYRTWSIARDEVISRLITRHPHLMQQIADFQEGNIYWPISVKLGVHYQRFPLLAVEQVTLSSKTGKLSQVIWGQLCRLSKLKTLAINMPPLMEGPVHACDWTYLRSFPHLRCLSAITDTCKSNFNDSYDDRKFRETVASLSQLEEVTIIQRNEAVPLLDISKMRALQKLTIENTSRLGECSRLLPHPSLKTLVIKNATFDSEEGSFSIVVDISKSRIEIELSSKGGAPVDTHDQAIRNDLIVRFHKAFPSITSFIVTNQAEGASETSVKE